MPSFYCGLPNKKMFLSFYNDVIYLRHCFKSYIALATQHDNNILGNFVDTHTLCMVYEVFAMVDEAEFTLLHRPYIGNFDQTSDRLVWNDKHFGEKFSTQTKYFELGGKGGTVSKNGFVRFGGNLPLLPPPSQVGAYGW